MVADRAWAVFWTLFNTVESVSFVLAVTLAVLGLAWGKAGLKRFKPKQEAACWRLAATLALIKLGCLALSLPAGLYQSFKR